MNSADKSYLEQIDKYYSRKLSSNDLITLGTTPEILVMFGASVLPLVMQQSTLTKCVRKNTGSRSAHELPRSVIETLPEQIRNPVFLIQDKERNSIALICDTKDRHDNNILIAIRLNERRKEIQVNEIKSIYGKTSLKEYLYKHMKLGQLNVIDNKKAGIISRVLGLQLPTTLINSNFNKSIALVPPKVNMQNKSVIQSLHKYQKEITKKHPIGNNLEHQRPDQER